MRAKSADQITKPRLSPVTAAVAAVVGTGYAAGAVLAQEGPAVARPALEEVVVTASRRETTVQDVPFNITALSGRMLEERRLTTLNEFSRWVPGMTVVDQGSRGSNVMTVRGLNVLSLNASEALSNSSGDTVATYLGEIPLYLDLKMKDIERVEVLMGPQGTLYGAGTLGGAVRYIPNAPGTREFSASIHGDVYDLAQSDSAGYDADFVVNVPLVRDRLAFRGSFSYLDDPGFVDYPYLVREPGVSNPEPDLGDPAAVAANLRRENDANYERTETGRLALLWEATDSVQATFNYYHQDQDAGGRTVNHRHAFGTGKYESAHRFLEPNERRNDLVSVEVVADLGFAELTSATGLSQYEERGQRDQTDLLLSFGFGYEDFPSFVAYTREQFDQERVNQELRLVSTGTGPWQWIAGVFYNEDEWNSTSGEYVPGYPEFEGIDVPTGDLEYLQTTRSIRTEQAVYGEIGYDVTSRWTVTAGGRAFEYEDDQFVGFDVPLVNFSNAQANMAEDDGFLGKLNASYRFGDAATGYVTLSEGYRIGGVNSVAPCELPLQPGHVCALPHEIPIDPDRTTNYEVGVHATLDDGRLRLDAAVYTIDWDDIQTQSTTENGQAPIIVNGGSARTRGAELSFRHAGYGPWSFSGSYALNSAELTSDAPGLVDGADAFSGDRLSGTPERQLSLFASYARALDNGWWLDATYGATFTSDVLTKVGLRNDGETLSGYTVHQASLAFSRDQWSAALYADNLTDEFAETSVRQDPTHIGESGGFAMRRYFRNMIRPRTIGIEFRYQLGD